MTSSIVEPRRPAPSRGRPSGPGPALRRLTEVLPPPPAPPTPPPARPPLTGAGTMPPRVAVAEDAATPAQVARVLHAAVELLGGRRPAAQLATVLRPDLLEQLLALRRVTGHLEPRVRRMFARTPDPAAAALEAVVLVTMRTGVRALAARFEHQPDSNGWRCTTLQLRLTPGDLTTPRR